MDETHTHRTGVVLLARRDSSEDYVRSRINERVEGMSYMSGPQTEGQKDTEKCSTRSYFSRKLGLSLGNQEEENRQATHLPSKIMSEKCAAQSRTADSTPTATRLI